MKIEEEIKQRKFKNEHHKALINVLYTSGWMQQKQAALFKPFGLTLPQFNILRILRGQYPKPATINLLIERMLDKTSNASRIVDKLENKGLVSREQCPNDRRTVDVLITEKGLDLLKQMDGLEDSRKIGIGNLSEAEAEELNRLLDKIRD
ncbi:MAG: MarR family transcriptional regulator [Hymenobacteraceae bacterium]|nr:MarR family transcriptional regulator [Hymenobacteraceae bacterium]MDX5394750.1 MarR family transcriptional regulator [Hymenobacteraceae bacterium]MDX5444421.1 MarR family transcriptional regulator [Hymenobacteraceae bacterium]MDX5510783.1 MarR family transcriptional regulator [Hymenobacteraceae bacterium]